MRRPVETGRFLHLEHLMTLFCPLSPTLWITFKIKNLA